jgi:hypothetical protein
MTPEAFFDTTLAPVSQYLGAQGAAHILVGCIPEASVVRFLTNVQGKARVEMLRMLARSLNQAADQLEKPSPLILPRGMK